MFDLWGFLLQTLTASGVAVLLLIIKALFKDKLPPKWHFTVWGVLGIMILIPAGLNGRYTLFQWQLVVEVIKSWFGDYTFTRVLFPVPIITAIPKTILQWIFAGYTLGVVAHVIRYLVSYIQLRLALRNGSQPSDEVYNRIRQIAVAQNVKIGKAIEVPGLPSAFVCGIIRPVLVLPTDGDLDDKVILHELLHMKYRDALWSIVICLLRCIHWCNPFLVYCANQAINDMEARCDQHVLEQLEGEERRDYGRILLSMANDRFAKTPGSTCINNGGKNIRERIEAIARFKKYPAGMKLVSVCVIILLTLSLVVGVQASTIYDWSSNTIWLPLASARSTSCITPAGAFDTYAKAVLDQNGLYRVMCAPESMQKEIIDEIREKEKTGIFPSWDCGLSEWPNSQSGYYIYNLKQCDKNTYEGLLVIKVNYPPDGQPEEDGKMYIAIQKLRVEKENGRWVAIDSEAFQTLEVMEQDLEWGCIELSGNIYTGTHDKIRVDVKVQTVYKIESTEQTGNNMSPFGHTPAFDTTPKPNAEFTRGIRTQSSSITHLGTAAERDFISGVGLSIAPVYSGEKPPEKLNAATYDSGGGSSTGESWGARKTEPGWGPTLEMNTGDGGSFDPNREVVIPEYYRADLYVNSEITAHLDLYPQEGVAE